MVLGSWKTPALKPSNIIPPCEIYGNIFFTESAQNADYVVYVQSKELFADVVIYIEEEFSYADRQGHWFITDEVILADSRIYITENISEADYTIAYTDFESFAGCDQ